MKYFLQMKPEDRFSMNFTYRENLKYVSYFMVTFILDKKKEEEKKSYAFFKIPKLQNNLNS